MKITISDEGKPDWVVDVSESAAKMVRANFNPSMLSEVEVLKHLSGALITMMEPGKKGGGDKGRCAALAITNYEQAAMWAVKSATASD